MNRLEQIAKRLAEIKGLLESDQTLNIEELEKEVKALNEEKAQIESRTALANAINAGAVETRKVDGPGDVENRVKNDAKPDEREERGRKLLEMRSVTVGSSNIILPRHDATDVKPTFNEVSSLIDRVNQLNLPGGESFRQPYMKGFGIGDYKAEADDYATAEPVFDYAEMGKAKITAYAEDSEEVTKLPAANYDVVVVNGIVEALRKKITREILIGNGTTNHLTGIFDDGATAIEADDLSLKEIDETTLDEIIYSFGGDEDVEDVSVLILNKMDLKAFATLRDAEGRRIYRVVNNGNTGSIDGVPFIINSACKPISSVLTDPGDYAMAYGPLSNYTLAILSPADVQRSTDYKFKQGMIAHRGSIFVAGNVTAYNGFLRVKKGGGE